ncbi:MAG: alpha/beta fold hydrolase [Methylococcales bacterium]|nr:alpha/beta fold hydrolase [Methylococcales bacterium]
MKIHKEIYGKGDPIVLLHGWAMHTGIWRNFAQKLAQNYQVICLDLPSHGRSDSLPNFQLDKISAALVEAFPKEPCTVLGWSLGATIALDLNHRFPDKVKQLVLLTGNPCFVKNERWAGMELTLLHRFAHNLMNDCQATLVRFLSLQILGLPTYKTLVKTLTLALQETPVTPKSALEQGLLILEKQDLRPALASLNCPVMAILGDRDTLIPVAIGQQMQALQPTLSLHILKKSGHVPFLSHENELLSLLTTFMENTHVS